MINWSDEALEAAAKAWLESGNETTNKQVLLNILNAASNAQFSETLFLKEKINERFRKR